MGRVSETMSPVLLSISPEGALADAERAMSDRHVHHLLVMRGADLVGVVCACDVNRPDRGTRIDRVMSPRVVCLPADSTVEEAVAVMRRERIGFLPVVHEGAVVGVITRGDLARALGRDRESGLMLACSWCGSHRHVNFKPTLGVAICDECQADAEVSDLGEGD